MPGQAFFATASKTGGLPGEEGLTPHAPAERSAPVSPRRGRLHPGGIDDRSPFGIEQSPGHCTDLIEKSECGVGSAFVDGAGLGEKAKMGVDLFC